MRSEGWEQDITNLGPLGEHKDLGEKICFRPMKNLNYNECLCAHVQLCTNY